MNDQDRILHNLQLWLMAGQYIYLDCLRMTTSAADHKANKSYNRLLSVNKGPFKEIKVLPMTVTIDGDGIQDTVYMGRDILDPSAKMQTGCHGEYMPKEPVEEPKENVDAGEGQTLAEELADATGEYAFDRIVVTLVTAIPLDTPSGAKAAKRLAILSIRLSPSLSTSLLTIGA